MVNVWIHCKFKVKSWDTICRGSLKYEIIYLLTSPCLEFYRKIGTSSWEDVILIKDIFIEGDTMPNTADLTFVANDSTNQLLLITSKDCEDWSENIPIGKKSQFTPALAVFDEQLHLAFAATDGTNQLDLTKSVDGVVWFPGWHVGKASQTAPAITIQFTK